MWQQVVVCGVYQVCVLWFDLVGLYFIVNSVGYVGGQIIVDVQNLFEWYIQMFCCKVVYVGKWFGVVIWFGVQYEVEIVVQIEQFWVGVVIGNCYQWLFFCQFCQCIVCFLWDIDVVVLVGEVFYCCIGFCFCCFGGEFGIMYI